MSDTLPFTQRAYVAETVLATAAAWAGTGSFLLQAYQFGVESDTGKAKLGDGTTSWSGLSYWNPGGGGGSGSVTEVSSANADITVVTGTTTPVLTNVGRTTPTASTPAGRDVNANLSANNFLPGFLSTATAAGTTVLTVASAAIQEFTGSTTQTVTLPVVSTLVKGQGFAIVNKSTGAVTVNSSGGNLVQTVGANTTAIITCSLITGTTAASWDSTYIVSPDVNNNLSLNNHVSAFATTATAAGTTTLTVASAKIQEFTGATTQNCKLPVVSTLPQAGFSFWVFNNSSGVVTVQSSGANTVKALAANTAGYFAANALTGTGASVWDFAYIGASGSVTNSAGNNVIAKSDGTNLVASSLTDTGTAITTNSTFTAGSATTSRQFVIRDLNGNNYAALYVGSLGVGDTNYTLAGGGADTRVNAPSSGTLQLMIANTAQMTFDGTSATWGSGAKPVLDRTITAGGTTGNQTINKMAGTVNIAAAGTTVTVTNSLVNSSSIIFGVIRTNDSTATLKNIVPGTGSFVITLTAAATAEVSIGWFVTN